MTPDQFAAILDTWPQSNATNQHTVVSAMPPPDDVMRACVDLAPLLLDLWRAAEVWEAHDPHHHEGTVCLSQDELREALAALEATT